MDKRLTCPRCPNKEHFLVNYKKVEGELENGTMGQVVDISCGKCGFIINEEGIEVKK